MIVIDGSSGEGGGQILRTTVALSALTGQPVKISNIRAKRPNPGLQAQHITAVKAAAELSDAKVKGLSPRSSEVEFFPAEISGKSFRVDIGTAGSITLVLQALMIAAINTKASVEVEITGGTDVNWSPPFNYLKEVALTALQKFGYHAEVALLKRGFYPKGGGKVKVKIAPSKLKGIDLTEQNGVEKINGVSFAHQALASAKVAERQKEAAGRIIRQKFGKIELNIREEYVETLSLGSGVVLWTRDKQMILGADSLGAPGKRAEKVGEEAARDMIEEIGSGACLDRYLADQIVPYLALASGKATVSQVTLHTTTHIEVVRAFGFKVKLDNRTIVGG